MEPTHPSAGTAALLPLHDLLKAQWGSERTSQHDDDSVGALATNLQGTDSAALRRADAQGNTPLHLAAMYSRPTIIAVLLSFASPKPERGNCDLWTRNLNHLTPIKLVDREIAKRRKKNSAMTT